MVRMMNLSQSSFYPVLNRAITQVGRLERGRSRNSYSGETTTIKGAKDEPVDNPNNPNNNNKDKDNNKDKQPFWTSLFTPLVDNSAGSGIASPYI